MILNMCESAHGTLSSINDQTKNSGKNIKKSWRDNTINSTKYVSSKMNYEMLCNKIKQEKSLDIAKRVQEFGHNLPVILQTIFKEENDRILNQSHDEVEVLHQYETRKMNMQYKALVDGSTGDSIRKKRRNEVIQNYK